jgi:hypothetical protein
MAQDTNLGAPCFSGARQFPADAVERCLVASCDDYLAAFGSESAGDGQSDATSGAGNESNLTAQATARCISRP